MKLQNNTTSNRLGGYLTAAVTCSTLASTASAAIVTFANNGSFVQGRSGDVDQPTITVALPGGENLFIDPGGYGTFLDFAFASNFSDRDGRFTGVGTFYSYYADDYYPVISLLNFGAPIAANNSIGYASIGSLVNDGDVQLDFVGDVSGYIGFITPLGNKGWMDVAYNSATGLFQYNGGAVATAGEALTAGQVPEPSTAVLSLGALAAGALIRRRKQVA